MVGNKPILPNQQFISMVARIARAIAQRKGVQDANGS